MNLFSKHNIQKISSAVLLCSYLLLQLGFPLVSAYGENVLDVQGYAADTIAGYTTTVRTSLVSPEQDLMLELTKPSGAVVQLPFAAGPDGYGKIEVNAYHTQQAGLYKIATYFPGKKDRANYASFRVYADKPSLQLSQVQESKNSAEANGNDAVYITVTLYDAFKNPVPNQLVKSISSRSIDELTLGSQTNFTNADGKVVYKVSSMSDGISTITILNATSNEVLEERVNILFQKAFSGGVGGDGRSLSGNAFQASLLAQSGNTLGATTTQAAARILVSTNPISPAVNENFDITVEALTAAGAPALDYRGTIIFTSDDPLAQLPLKDTGYTFTGAEQPAGKKIFAKAAQFSTSGSKTITIKDQADPTLKGTVTVAVGGNSTSTEKISIITPQPGILTSKDVLVKGKAKPFMKLKFFDNNDEVTQAQADDAGSFEGTLSALVDGTHSLTVKGYDDAGMLVTTSDAIDFTIKASVPFVKKITFSPVQDTYAPGQTITVSVDSEPELSAASLVINNISIPLVEDPITKGTYTASLTLPTTAGSFVPKVQLKNKLGITAEQAASTALNVQEVAFDLNTLKFEPQPDGTVKVSWTAPANTSGITGYQMLHGLDQQNMKDMQPVNLSETSIVTSGLTPATPYFFQFQVLGQNNAVVKASEVKQVVTSDALSIDNATTSSGEKGLVIAWTLKGATAKVAQFRIIYGFEPGKLTAGEKLVATGTLKAELTDVLVGKQYYIRIKALDAQEKVLTESKDISGTYTPLKPAASEVCVPGDVQNLHLIMQDGKRTLTWDSVEGIEMYRVFVGTKPNTYDLPPVDVYNTFYALPPLEKKIKNYYFAVSAVCADGTMSKRQSNMLKVQSGPLAAMLLVIAAGTTAFVWRRRRGMFIA